MKYLIGTYLGQYELVDVLGRSATATVFKAQQARLGRFVAVKVLAPQLDPQFADRFQQEARIVAQLQHPNILPIYDYGEQDGLLYFVLQYVEHGTTLEHVIAGQPVAPLTALRITEALLAGLAHAHTRGVIHRDLKPSNVLMPTQTWPLLADFGIAKLVNDMKSLTLQGQTIGTAMYMAPERAKGQPADVRSDLYSVGVMLYEMLTGRVPFDAPTPMAVLAQHVTDTPPPARRFNPTLPIEAERVVLRALEKQPHARFQTADQMAHALAQLRQQLEAAAPADAEQAAPDQINTAPTMINQSAIVHHTPRRRSRRLVLNVLAALLVLLISGVISATLTLGRMPDPIVRAARALAFRRADAPSALPTPSVVAIPTQAATATIAAATRTPEPAAITPTPVPATPEQTQFAAVPSTIAPSSSATVADQIACPPPSQHQDTPQMIHLSDSMWQGGSRAVPCEDELGVIGVYDAQSGANTMQTTFNVDVQPTGEAILSVRGLFARDRGVPQLRVTVNDQQIFAGIAALSTDVEQFADRWVTYSVRFDAAIVQPGANVIRIENVSDEPDGSYLLLDFTDMTFEAPPIP